MFDEANTVEAMVLRTYDQAGLVIRPGDPRLTAPRRMCFLRRHLPEHSYAIEP